MSMLEQIIKVPKYVRCKISGRILFFKIQECLFSFRIPKECEISMKDSKIVFVYSKKVEEVKIRSIIQKIQVSVNGFLSPYMQTVILSGIGYECKLIEDKYISLDIGYCNRLEIRIPKSLRAKITENGQKISIYGTTKEQVNLFASKLSRIKKFDKYNGKGLYIQGKKPELKERKK